jgi:hypothetical protein
LLCCAISYYVARQVKNHARLYTVLALFTGAWSLVAAAIERRLLEPDRPTDLSDRAQDVASFLLVYSGSSLTPFPLLAHLVLFPSPEQSAKSGNAP